MMEQYLLQLPPKLADKVRAAISNGDAANKIELISGADNQSFMLQFEDKQYPVKLAQMPTVIETHKTYDDNLLYKCGEIGQIFIVGEGEEDKKKLDSVDDLPHGITPPNTNVVKRKYAKTKHYTPFPKPEVSQVEEELNNIINSNTANNAIVETDTELVDFCDWMVDEAHPGGITVTDEMELIRKHPEYLELTNPAAAQAKALENDPSQPLALEMSKMEDKSGANTPMNASEVDGMESAQRSPAFTPSASPENSQDEKMDDLEDDILGDMEEKPSTNQDSYKTNPEYQRLTREKEALESKLKESEKEVTDWTIKMDGNANHIVKDRFRGMLEDAQRRRDEVKQQLEQIERQLGSYRTS